MSVIFCQGTCDGVKPKDLFTPNRATKLESTIAKMAVAKEASLNHISRESSDIRRLANFYKEIFGFEEIESPNFGDLEVIWLNLPKAFSLHQISDKGIETFQRSVPGRPIRQVFFFDPDGNGLEAASRDE